MYRNTHDEGFLAGEDGRRGSIIHIPHRAITDPLDPNHPIDPEYAAHNQSEFDFTTAPPAFNRTYSAPLPTAGLLHPLSPALSPANGYNAHPHRRKSNLSRPPMPDHSSSATTATATEVLVTPFETMSLEFADSLQTAIQTLLHLSPPHLLDNAKEQYSGCTVQVPTTSLSALLSSMRSLNYLSANVQSLCNEPLKPDEGILKHSEDFDIGELLQSVADLLSGQAAQAGVDFVLFHGDVGIKHISVCGDGEGLSYTLGHVSDGNLCTPLTSR